MKTLRRFLFLFALLGAASLVSAAVPPMDVTVSNSAGKLLFKGKTDAQGVFTTKSLAPGNYVVQFKSKSSKGGPYTLVVGAGKKKVVAESVPASKISKGGVALRVEVSKAISLSGQVAEAGQTTMAASAGSDKSNAKVKYVNGKKFVWVQGELGSNLGGRWVDANSPEGRNVQNVDTKSIQDLQSRH
ncbi:MAG: carboxypeptidase-like regulatory domain-containing protein [Chthoniobacterales bacterium]